MATPAEMESALILTQLVVMVTLSAQMAVMRRDVTVVRRDSKEGSIETFIINLFFLNKNLRRR